MLREKQHWDGRLFHLGDLLDVLACRMGMSKASYPESWAARTLIAFERRKDSGKVTGKGYGPDWKHEGVGIKYAILSATTSGRLPAAALKCAAELILAAEAQALVLVMAERIRERHAPPQLHAAD